MTKILKGNLGSDPRGLVYEAYRMSELTKADCRTIFLDWALGVSSARDLHTDIKELLQAYAANTPGHPMTEVLEEGLETARPAKRRGGRASRLN